MSGHLLENLLRFGRVLRGLGLDVNPVRVLDLVAATEHIQIGSRVDFYHTARTLLVHDVEDLALFDRAFALFWRHPSDAAATRTPTLEPQTHARPQSAEVVWPTTAPEGGWGDGPQVTRATLTYSTVAALRVKDFAALTPAEEVAVRRLIARLTWDLGRRRTRRLKFGAGAQPDLRQTIRRSLRYGGELLSWAERARRVRPRPLVVLADVSGSMERYTRLLLHFLYGLTSGLEPAVETFVFGTTLMRISRQLRHKRIETALREVSAVVNDWSGGTRIGACLKRFNFDWGRRVLGRGAVVLLISDGWDRGEPELLRHEMARLHRSAHRLIWLNPLLGAPDYEPLTRGMQAALPHVDDFLPVHNLASLEDLAERLSAVG